MNQKINNIQALRAFAAIAVVVFHTGFAAPHMKPVGSFGVDVFFVISGYIMARICETNSNFFLRRRLIRIVPPYWVMTLLLFVFALKYPQLLSATRASGIELVKSLLFIPFYKANGLLQPMLFVGWSLNYEVIFYLAIAAGLFLLPKRPLVLASGLILGLAGISHLFMHKGALPAFYGSVMMLDFILGIVAYEIARRVPEGFALRIRGLSLFLFLASMAGLIAIQGLTPWGSVTRWIVLGLPSMVLVLSASLLSQAGWDTRAKWIIVIGDASYILYLVHTYIEYLVDRTLAHRFPWLKISQLPGLLVVSVLAILIAVVLHLTIEKPAVGYLNQRFGGRRKSAEFEAKPAAPDQVAA